MADTFDKLHSEQDDFIRETFAQDKYTSLPVINEVKTHIKESKIKIDKYTHKQKKIIYLLAVLLIISVGVNIYNIFGPSLGTISLPKFEIPSKPTTSAPKEEPKKDKDKNKESVNEVYEKDPTIVESTPEENKVVTEDVVLNKEQNQVVVETQTIVANKTDKTPEVKEEEKVDTSKLNLDEVKEFIEDFGYGINRFSFNDETLESNTIKVLVANNYFIKKVARPGTKYASTKSNIHTFLKEAFGKEIPNTSYLETYTNYVAYKRAGDSYHYGPDYEVIDNETYTCSDLTIKSEKDGVYTARCSMVRNANGTDTTYDVEFTFSINSQYSYSKYCLTSLKAKNMTFYPDNTIHFVAQ